MTTYTLQDLMYAKGTSEPVRQALQAQAVEIERLRDALEQTYAALLPHKSTVLRWYTPTDKALDAARAALENTND